MDPMLVSALISGGSAISQSASDLIGAVGNYHVNRELQELDQEFQSNEARKARKWQATQNEINRDWQTNANKIAMDFSHNEALAQRDWNEYMSSTARQRDVADLKAAGLNPILAASSLGADYSSGATASGVSTSATSSGTPNSAHGSAQHANFNFKGFADSVHQFMSTAHEISKRADQYQHEEYMLEKKQQHQKYMADKKHRLEKDMFKYKNPYVQSEGIYQRLMREGLFD